jgi:hypothetical protein
METYPEDSSPESHWVLVDLTLRKPFLGNCPFSGKNVKGPVTLNTLPAALAS